MLHGQVSHCKSVVLPFDPQILRVKTVVNIFLRRDRSNTIEPHINYALSFGLSGTKESLVAAQRLILSGRDNLARHNYSRPDYQAAQTNWRDQ